MFYKKDLDPDSDCVGNDCYEGFALSVVEELSQRLSKLSFKKSITSILF